MIMSCEVKQPQLFCYFFFLFFSLDCSFPSGVLEPASPAYGQSQSTPGRIAHLNLWRFGILLKVPRQCSEGVLALVLNQDPFPSQPSGPID